MGLGQQGVSSRLTALWARRPSCPLCDPQLYPASPSPHSPFLSPLPKSRRSPLPLPTLRSHKDPPQPSEPVTRRALRAPDSAHPSVLGHHHPPLPPPPHGPGVRNKLAPPPTPSPLYPLQAALRRAAARWRSGPAHRPAGGATPAAGGWKGGRGGMRG